MHFWFGFGVRVQGPLPGLRRGFDRVKEEREEAGRLAGQSYRTFNPRPGTNFPNLIDGKSCLEMFYPTFPGMVGCFDDGYS